MKRAAAVLALWLRGVSIAHGGVADAPGEQLEVSLITYGPGAIYWERFGHNAIEIHDKLSDQAASFNYGVFDFDERGFLLNFARGYMHYLIDVAPSEADQKLYREEGRSVLRQRLQLGAGEAARLRDFLVQNLLPQNAHYDYDYLADNCSTRVRDAIDRVTGGALRAQLTQRPASMSYRAQIDRLMSAQPWMMLPMDFGLGPFADQPLDAWRESFLPAILARELSTVRIDDGHGASRLLVDAESEVAPNRLPPPPAAAPDLRPPLALAGACLAALIFLSLRRARTLAAVLATVFLGVGGIAGLFLLGLWTLTMHRAAWANTNLLLLNPLCFALLPAVWRARRGLATSMAVRTLLALQGVGILIGIVVHLLPAPTQQNQPWLLFSVPPWAAVAWMLLRRPRQNLSLPASVAPLRR